MKTNESKCVVRSLPGGPGDWSIVPYTKRLQISFPVRHVPGAHAGATDQCFSLTLMLLTSMSLSLSLPSSPSKINKTYP